MSDDAERHATNEARRVVLELLDELPKTIDRIAESAAALRRRRGVDGAAQGVYTPPPTAGDGETTPSTPGISPSLEKI
jgi:hypothetical protein